MGVSATYDRERLAQILRTQHDVVSRRQLLECGMDPGVIHRRTRGDGPWVSVLPGIYACAPVSDHGRETAACLYAGPAGVVTGAFALKHFGLSAVLPDRIEVLVPVGVRRQSAQFVRLIRTARMPAQTYRAGPIRIAEPTRAAGDAARSYRCISDARAVICEVTRRQLCSLSGLRQELSEGPRQGSALLLRSLRDAARGIWSAAEGDLMDLIDRSGLPQPEYNVALYAEDGTFLGIVDAWWQRAGVAAEVDSQEFHFLPQDWRETLKRHNRITKHRVQLMHFPPHRIKTDGPGVIGDLRNVWMAPSMSLGRGECGFNAMDGAIDRWVGGRAARRRGGADQASACGQASARSLRVSARSWGRTRVRPTTGMKLVSPPHRGTTCWCR
jgi:hypothetical protein